MKINYFTCFKIFEFTLVNNVYLKKEKPKNNKHYKWNIGLLGFYDIK